MLKNSGFWIKLFIAGAVLLLIGGEARAQSIAPLSFDALPRNHKTDTVKVAAPKKKLPPTVTRVRVDTVHVTQTVVDTVFVNRGAAPAPVNAPTVTVAPKSAAAVAPAAIAFAPTSVSGLLQVMLSGGDSALKSTYRVRRAEVKVVSDLGRKAQAIVMVDVAKALSVATSGSATTVAQSSRILQDAILSVPIARVQVDAGQQRLPLGYEGSLSASTLETVDRALMESDKARGASFGDVRDLGVAVKGRWRWLDYRSGVFNGSGETQNDVDKNVGKAVVGQLGFRPTFLKGLRIGASGVTSGAAKGDKPARDRVGADLVYTHSRALIQAEAMHGQDGATIRQGMYALTSVNALATLKVVARFDAWDPDTKKEGTAADVTERDYLVGLTWLPSGTRFKLQFAAVRKTYSHDITPSVTQALTQLQASW